MLNPAILAPAIPGKEARYRETAPRDLTELARHLAREIAPDLCPPYRIFGYSMGGVLGFELALALKSMGLPEPLYLVVLGALPPQHLQSELADILALDSTEFWDEIATLGGTPDEILKSVEMKDLLEPVLRSDFAICAEHVHSGTQLNCRIHFMRAKDDTLLTNETVKGWQGCTNGVVREHLLEGGHMLDAESFARLPALIDQLLTSI